MWGYFLAGLVTTHPVSIIIFITLSIVYGLLYINTKEIDNA